MNNERSIIMNEFKFVLRIDREDLEFMIKHIIEKKELGYLGYSENEIEKIIDYIIDQQDSWGDAIEIPVEETINGLIDDVMFNEEWKGN
jgi:hypothetical protein